MDNPLEIGLNKMDLHDLGKRYGARVQIDTTHCIDDGDNLVTHYFVQLANKMAAELLESNLITARQVDENTTVLEADLIIMTRDEYIGLLYTVQKALGTTVIHSHG